MTLLAFAKHWLACHSLDKCQSNSIMQLCTIFVAMRHNESSWGIVVDYFNRLLKDYKEYMQ